MRGRVCPPCSGYTHRPRHGPRRRPASRVWCTAFAVSWRNSRKLELRSILTITASDLGKMVDGASAVHKCQTNDKTRWGRRSLGLRMVRCPARSTKLMWARSSRRHLGSLRMDRPVGTAMSCVALSLPAEYFGSRAGWSAKRFCSLDTSGEFGNELGESTRI